MKRVLVIALFCIMVPALCFGGTVTLTADTTNGTGTVTYQWLESTDNITKIHGNKDDPEKL